MKRYIIASLLLSFVAFVVFAHPDQFLASSGAFGQKRGTKVATPASKPGAKDYSKFSHTTKEHKLDCKNCHKALTAKSQEVRDFPDVAVFPDHASCLGPCHDHRNEFFKGAQPSICLVCHEKSSPRDKKLMDSPYVRQTMQFKTVFPHDKHQDVLASLRPQAKPGASINRTFIKSAHAADDKTKKYNYCQICHDAYQPPVMPAAGWPDKYEPKPDTFKSSPNSHASCFNCHWSGQLPTRDDCQGCHQFADAPRAPLPNPERMSMRFRHGGGDDSTGKTHSHLNDNCTSCHINITKPELKPKTMPATKPELIKLTADVPIFPGCTDVCHKAKFKEEMTAYKKAPTSFNCIYCHTTDVARKPLPESHNAALKQQ